jgi:hypothetical protein
MPAEPAKRLAISQRALGTTETTVVRGYVYDVEAGELREVACD